MALVVNGPFVVQASSSAQPPQVDSLGTLKACVAKTVNGETQPNILKDAEDGIKKGIDDMNLRHEFRFGVKHQTAATIVDGTDEYGIPADSFAIEEVMLLKDGVPFKKLDYFPWGQFQELAGNQDKTSTVPDSWTVLNSFDDEVFQIYPVPNSTTASTYTLRLTYYQRVEQVSSDTDIIDAPREVGYVLCLYGEYYVKLKRWPENTGAWGHIWGRYKDALRALKNRDKKTPAHNPIMRVLRK